MKYQLIHKLQYYVQNVASGMDSVQAAKAAGYRASYAKVLAARLKHHPIVVRALTEIREKGCAATAYDLVRAMTEAQAVCDFAKQHKNAMAYCKGTELRAKLSGRLIERVEVVAVDLRGGWKRRGLGCSPCERVNLRL